MTSISTEQLRQKISVNNLPVQTHLMNVDNINTLKNDVYSYTLKSTINLLFYLLHLFKKYIHCYTVYCAPFTNTDKTIAIINI